MSRVYGEISHYRAPFKNSVLSGFGADAAADPATQGNVFVEPFTKQGKEVADAAILGLIQQSEKSTGEMLRIKRELRDATLDFCSMLGGRVVALPSDVNGRGVTFILPRRNKNAGYSVDEGYPTMLQALSYWSGRTGRPDGFTEEALPSKQEFVLPGGSREIKPGERRWVYMTIMPIGDTYSPAFILTNLPLDSASCGDAARQAGLPGCSYFEVFDDKEGLPKSSKKLVGPIEVTTASMFGYASLGVAVAIGAIALFAGRSRKATPNRRRKARRNAKTCR